MAKITFITMLFNFFCTLTLCKNQPMLVDIENVNKNIILDIKYATENNFTKTKVYTKAKAYLVKEAAEQLNKVQQELEKKGLGLKIWDAYRPHKVQFIFWDLVPDERYVGDPKKGSRHNRGAAVDVTLVDSKGHELLMPTEFDHFGEKGHRSYNDLPLEAKKNRALLEDIMVKHGFQGLSTEWWHFDFKDWQNFPIQDISFEDLENQR